MIENQLNSVIKRILKSGLLLIPVILVILGCANRGAPLGGPKDADPPKVLATIPANRSINYKPGKEIKISFDEYVVLKNTNQEIIVSPPLKERVSAMVNNKNVIVKFPDNTVFDTTTYTINFGKSIVDNNEGNELKNYEFVFSLKNCIDSLNISGKIINSFDLKPNKDPYFIMLYANLNDSAPIKEKPKYICRTDENGNFSLNNLENGRYRIFALKDINNNLQFDLPDEQIAFGDSIIDLYAEKLITDTSINLLKPLKPQIQSKEKAEKKKELKTPVDTAKIDSLVKPLKNSYQQVLLFFQEIPKNQYLTNYLRSRPELLTFTFNQSLTEPLKIEPIGINTIDKWFIEDISKNQDTLKYWITDTSLISKDSLPVKIVYPIYDSTGSLISRTDTLYMNYLEKESKKPREKKRKHDEEVLSDSAKVIVKKLALKNSITNTAAFDLNAAIKYSSETPLYSVLESKIKVFKMEDTLQIPLENISVSNQTLYSFTLGLKPSEQTQYKILIPDSTVADIYGAINDTTIVSFKTQSEIFYGTLTMHVKNIKNPVILQLMDEKENIVRENLLTGNQAVRYEYLYPKNYMLKLIIDSNNNGKWDTGKYLEHRQPEKVIYYPQVINVRSNWEIDLNWEVEN